MWPSYVTARISTLGIMTLNPVPFLTPLFQIRRLVDLIYQWYASIDCHKHH